MNVSEAQKDLSSLVDKVYTEGVTIDLERDNKVVARLTPAPGQSSVTVAQFNDFLRALPRLGDDADSFAHDVRALRAAFPAETNPWD